jgi:peptide deformylase
LFHVPAHRTTEGEGPPPQGLTILVNPVIEPLTEEKELGWEGCLSLPGMMGAVPRFKRIRYRGLDLDGNPIEHEADGFHARVVQHECDHLDGILYPQRMEDLSLFGFADDMRKSFAELDKAEVD